MAARLPVATFGLDVAGLRAGTYSDQYFNNIQRLLTTLAAEEYRYGGQFPRPGLPDPSTLAVGDVAVEMQFFTKRQPHSVVAGIDHALAILSTCCGVGEGAAFESTAAQLEVAAVGEGDHLAPWAPALRLRGRYRDFARLETPLLGVLARRTRIASNTYEVCRAARGKPVLFFPARFDVPEVQAGDGWAYQVGVQAAARELGAPLRPAVSTAAQAAWWGGQGSGTMAHAYLLAFAADTAEATLQFARLLPPEVPRIALVDTNNDCVTDALRTAEALYREYRRWQAAGQPETAARYVLQGVRADTSERLRDAAVPALGDARLDCGVVPRLVTAIREALDSAGERLGAAAWFRNIKIVVTGGFDVERIALFERLGVPTDIYGVGSALLRGPSNDFTADVVQVHHAGSWIPLAKVGRGRVENPALAPVKLPLA
ncbi:MAG: hypothetical protein IT204_18665 [Fimbriimonadaceae bacterium]|nr:hypothetical protein [Fimbriimonadaceae bacterium]